MENKIYQDLATAEREEMLSAMCLRPEEQPVKKHFSEQEIIVMRRQLAENHIVIKKAGETLNEAKKIYNDAVSNPIKDNTYILQNLRAGYVEVNQQVYLFDDQENSMMNTYDCTGELIASRRLLPEERQQRIR